MKKKTVVIVNDHQLLSELLAHPLQGLGFGLPRTFNKLGKGIEHIIKHEPNLAILDMMLPTSRTRDGKSGDHHHPYILMDIQVTLRVVRHIKKERPQTPILILNGERHPNTYLVGFEAGADGIASKLDGLRSFTSILKQVLSGEKHVTSPRVRKLLDEYGRIPKPALSSIEVSILELVQEGKESREIGQKLGYSQQTIRNILTRINEKLGTSNRYEALGVAVDMGLVGWRMGDEI